jgi:ElaB/YqjD/DUF883 family membrane-anchored ribosome-binding protein
VATRETQLPRRDEPEGATGKAQEVASQAKEQVQEKAEEIKGTAGERVREELDTRSTQAGEHVSAFGQAMRVAAEQLQGDGKEPGAKVAGRAADQMERLGGYLTGSSSDRFIADVESFGRRRPWVAGAIGAAAGFVAARFLKASSESRYQRSYGGRPEAAPPVRRETELPMRRDEDPAAAPVSPTWDYGSGSR